MLDISSDSTAKLILSYVSNFSIIIGAASGGLALIAKANELWKNLAEKRRLEIQRLLTEFDKNQNIFADIFDYSSALDEHLRIERLSFDKTETKTRSDVDKAFEHLRDVHNSLRLGLIRKADLAPWIYWIHRIKTRGALMNYAKACGYLVFINRLSNLTKNSHELKELEQFCPWWKKHE